MIKVLFLSLFILVTTNIQGMEQAVPKVFNAIQENFRGLAHNMLSEIDTGLYVLVDDVLRDHRKIQSNNGNVSTISAALRNPNLFIVNEEHSNIAELLSEEEITAVKANKYFISILNQKQKEVLLHHIHKYNQNLFNEIRSQLAYIHKEDPAVSQKITDTKNVQELKTVLNTKEVHKTLKNLMLTLEAETETLKVLKECLQILRSLVTRLTYFVQAEEAFTTTAK